MFERFTDRARQVIVLAQDEARTLMHNYIGTEHILLGLLREEEGLAAIALRSLSVNMEVVRDRVVEEVGRGEGMETGQVPFTPQAKEALNNALQEALALGHSYIGTEHILLGLVRDDSGLESRLLAELGADAAAIHDALLPLLPPPSSGPPRTAYDEKAPSHTPDVPITEPSVHDRFTERAREVVVLAEAEARSLNHEWLNTEHLLLGLLRDEHNLAATVLATFLIICEEVHAQVVQIEGPGDESVNKSIQIMP